MKIETFSKWYCWAFYVVTPFVTIVFCIEVEFERHLKLFILNENLVGKYHREQHKTMFCTIKPEFTLSFLTYIYIEWTFLKRHFLILDICNLYPIFYVLSNAFTHSINIQTRPTVIYIQQGKCRYEGHWIRLFIFLRKLAL